MTDHRSSKGFFIVLKSDIEALESSIDIGVWVTFLALASYREKEIRWQGKKKTLKPGQFEVNISDLCREFQVQRSRMQRSLKLFAELGWIDTQRGRHTTLITINEWEVIQQPKKFREFRDKLKCSEVTNSMTNSMTNWERSNGSSKPNQGNDLDKVAHVDKKNNDKLDDKLDDKLVTNWRQTETPSTNGDKAFGASKQLNNKNKFKQRKEEEEDARAYDPLDDKKEPQPQQQPAKKKTKATRKRNTSSEARNTVYNSSHEFERVFYHLNQWSAYSEVFDVPRDTQFLRDMMEDFGLSRVDLIREAGSCVRYYTSGKGKNRRIKDAPGAFRNWLKNAVKFDAERKQERKSQTGHMAEECNNWSQEEIDDWNSIFKA